MKKTHRAVLSILLVLALLTALPLTAMAEGEGGGESGTPSEKVNETANANLSENYDKNTADNVTVATDGKVGTNTGTITSNAGTITNNGVKPAEGQTADPASGTVGLNKGFGTIENNYGTVVKNATSSAPPDVNKTCGVTNNYGVIKENTGNGTVSTNHSGAIVEKNCSTVYDNFGKVNNETRGYVNNNYANAEVINNGGEVGRNEKGGIVKNYSGKVDTNYGTVIDNKGEVWQNYGEIAINPVGGTVSNNWSGGTIGLNQGTVSENIEGEVTVNDIMGTVTNNIDYGGSVKTNYGTVIEMTYIPEESSSSYTTYYGVHGEDKDGNKYYYKDTAENQPGNTAFVGYEKGAEVDLDKVVSQYKRDGYKLTEYKIQVYQNGEFSDYAPDKEVAALSNVDAGDGGGDGEGEAAKPLYRISAPTRLKLFWEKIVTAVAPTASSGGGAEAVPTSYNPKYIGLGSVIFINEKGYKVVEIKDDAYVVVSFDALPDEDVQDLDALYAKLFTPEQQKLIKNVGQLLDAEDVLTVFGKPGNHPVYEINKSLVE